MASFERGDSMAFEYNKERKEYVRVVKVLVDKQPDEAPEEPKETEERKDGV